MVALQRHLQEMNKNFVHQQLQLSLELMPQYSQVLEHGH
jgi:hypothetical protein